MQKATETKNQSTSFHSQLKLKFALVEKEYQFLAKKVPQAIEFAEKTKLSLSLSSRPFKPPSNSSLTEIANLTDLGETQNNVQTMAPYSIFN